MKYQFLGLKLDVQYLWRLGNTELKEECEVWLENTKLNLVGIYGLLFTLTSLIF